MKIEVTLQPRLERDAAVALERSLLRFRSYLVRSGLFRIFCEYVRNLYVDYIDGIEAPFEADHPSEDEHKSTPVPNDSLATYFITITEEASASVDAARRANAALRARLREREAIVYGLRKQVAYNCAIKEVYNYLWGRQVEPSMVTEPSVEESQDATENKKNLEKARYTKLLNAGYGNIMNLVGHLRANSREENIQFTSEQQALISTLCQVGENPNEPEAEPEHTSTDPQTL